MKISASLNMNLNGAMFGSITSTSQVLNTYSKLDLVEISSQMPPPLVRVPGAGKDQIVQVSPDFDDTLEFNL